MISQINNAVVSSAFSNNGQSKVSSQKSVNSVSQQGDTSKVDQIKEAIESGEYKVNLEALSKKIADELM